MPPNTLSSIEPLQLLLLEAVRGALADAGYARRPFDRQRTAMILGAGGGAAQLSMAYAFQSYLPMLETVPGLEGVASEVLHRCEHLLPKWTEDTFPGILLKFENNVTVQIVNILFRTRIRQFPSICAHLFFISVT